MSQDYKNRIPAYRQARYHRSPKWGVVAAAIGVTALSVGLGVYFLKAPEGETPPPESVGVSAASLEAEPGPGPTRKAPSQDKKPAETGAGRAPETQPPQEPRFTFYKILAEKEVIIAEHEIKTMKREESQGKKPETAYLLQAGSFTSQQDAEKVKARLAEIKVKAKLEKISLDNTAWYRVKIGPYATLADADKVRQYLRTHKIDSVVQKAVK